MRGLEEHAWALAVVLLVALAPNAAARPKQVTCAGAEPTIAGSEAGETVVGTSRNDVIYAGGGNDAVQGLGGDDVICGGRGTTPSTAVTETTRWGTTSCSARTAKIRWTEVSGTTDS